jgi:hypothetical protein
MQYSAVCTNSTAQQQFQKAAQTMLLHISHFRTATATAAGVRYINLPSGISGKYKGLKLKIQAVQDGRSVDWKIVTDVSNNKIPLCARSSSPRQLKMLVASRQSIHCNTTAAPLLGPQGAYQPTVVTRQNLFLRF